jgi:acetyl-CoA C-acetyltransferase
MKIAITHAIRTPIGSFGGGLKDVSAPHLASHLIGHLSLETRSRIRQVYLGNVLQAGLGQGPARQAWLNAGGNPEVPCTTLNKVCGSGMKAIEMGCFDAPTLVGGMESMSRSPYLMNRVPPKWGPITMMDHMMHDGLENAYDGLSMGVLAERIASHYQISRHDQEEFVRCGVHDYHEASFEREIVAMGDCAEDEHPKRVDPLKFERLRPAFDPSGTITAATSSSITDGAAILVLEKEADNPLGYIVGIESYAGEPAFFASTPLHAIRQLCNKLQWDPREVDLFEINEAFAIVPIIVMRELNLRRETINVKGGACVIGHPIGASGARVVVTLIHAMIERHAKRGIASVCIGGGEGMAIAIERFE